MENPKLRNLRMLKGTSYSFLIRLKENKNNKYTYTNIMSRYKDTDKFIL